VLGTVEEYSPGTNTWTARAALPTPRDHAVAGAIGGMIFVAGGDCAANACAGVLEIYNPKPNQWFSGEPEPIGRYAAGAGVLGYSLYVAGGHNNVLATNVGGTEVFTLTVDTPGASGGVIALAAVLLLGLGAHQIRRMRKEAALRA
jgi:Kelch motif protein